jgi:signal transduction histidine kinase
MENMCNAIWHCFVLIFSNAVKFTHEGKVGINLQVVHDQQPGWKKEHGKIHKWVYSVCPITIVGENFATSPRNFDKDTLRCSKHEEAFQKGISTGEYVKEDGEGDEVVWLRYDVYDTGIGIPGLSWQLLIIS